MQASVLGGRVVGILGLGAGLAGATACQGKDISTGDESSAFNLSRCYGAGTRCGIMPTTTLGREVATPDCPATPVGTLTEQLSFSVGSAGRMLGAPDGSLWTLTGAFSQDPVVLAHYSADGALLGSSAPLAEQANHTLVTANLGVNAAGHALVSVYSAYARTADDEVTERQTLYEFDADLLPVREPLLFLGSGGSYLASDGEDTFTISGDATHNQAHGVLARFTQGEPEWVQTAVPSSGAGAGVGVSALAISPKGEASVLAQRSPGWQPGAPDESRFGIARFDQGGNLLWNLVLPTAYAGGYHAELTSNGADLILSGQAALDQMLVHKVSSAGRLLWGMRLPGHGAEHPLAVDPSTGSVFVAAGNALARISADGTRCEQYDLPQPSGGGAMMGVVAAAPYLYLLSERAVQRYQLPSE